MKIYKCNVEFFKLKNDRYKKYNDLTFLFSSFDDAKKSLLIMAKNARKDGYRIESIAHRKTDVYLCLGKLGSFISADIQTDITFDFATTELYNILTK